MFGDVRQFTADFPRLPSYNMPHLAHAAVSRIGWCISGAHTGLQPGAPCSPALTLCGEAPLPLHGLAAPWRGVFSLSPPKLGAPQPEQPLLPLGRAVCPPRQERLVVTSVPAPGTQVKPREPRRQAGCWHTSSQVFPLPEPPPRVWEMGK